MPTTLKTSCFLNYCIQGFCLEIRQKSGSNTHLMTNSFQTHFKLISIVFEVYMSLKIEITNILSHIPYTRLDVCQEVKEQRKQLSDHLLRRINDRQWGDDTSGGQV